MAYRITCSQCEYKDKAKNHIEAQYLRNKHLKENNHFEVEYERIA